MKDNENKRVSILVEDDDPNNQKETPKDGAQNKAEKLKKPIIFVLMAAGFFCVVAGFVQDGRRFMTSSFGSVMSSMAYRTPSRPIPESFTPP